MKGAKIMTAKSKDHFSKLMLSCVMLLTTFIVGCGCNMPKPAPDPLAGFRVLDLQNLDSNKVISADYKNYIQTLSSEEQKYATLDYYYEGGIGQHAVSIMVRINHVDWHHILIYDKNDKRIKAIKYISGHSAS